MPRIIIIISICLLISLVVGGILFWWPNFRDFLSSREELEIKEAQLKQKEEYFAKLNTLSEELKKYPQELAKIDSALSVDPSVSALFSFVQKASSESGLVLRNLNLGKISSSKEKAGVNEISFYISVSGTYFAFKNFLSTVYRSSRIIEIDNINFFYPGEDNLFSFDLSLTSYSYLLEE